MKATLLGGWVRTYGVSTLFVLAGALALTGACADDAQDTGVTGGSATGTTAGANGGTSAGAPNGANGASTNGESTNGESANGASANGASGTTGSEDGGGMSATDPADAPETPGNDSPEATACKGQPSCAYATQSCCVSGVGSAECIDGNACPTGGLIPPARTVCDGPEDCEGEQVCCVAVNPTGATNSCQDSCEDVSGLIGVWQLCHIDDDCPTGDKSVCAADDTFPFWGFCG